MNNPFLPAVRKDVYQCLAHIHTSTGRRRSLEKGHIHLGLDDPFIDDEQRILFSKAFRRLGDKTQVVSFPCNFHIRNRMSHTAEVVACSVIIAETLGLNVNLVRAIALGHDIGHVPFGHAGEKFIAERSGKPFLHEVMGVVIAQHIERKGFGLNLTHETLDGMRQHSAGDGTVKVAVIMTPEARIVRYADKIAYLFADLNDFRRIGFPIGNELLKVEGYFGTTQRERVSVVVAALCLESKERGHIFFTDSLVAKKFWHLRTLMYAMYPRVAAQNPRRVLEPVYDLLERTKLGDPAVALSLMTDRDVLYLAGKPMPDVSHIRKTSIGELLELLEEKTINFSDPDMDW